LIGHDEEELFGGLVDDAGADADAGRGDDDGDVAADLHQAGSRGDVECWGDSVARRLG